MFLSCLLLKPRSKLLSVRSVDRNEALRPVVGPEHHPPRERVVMYEQHYSVGDLFWSYQDGGRRHGLRHAFLFRHPCKGLLHRRGLYPTRADAVHANAHFLFERSQGGGEAHYPCFASRVLRGVVCPVADPRHRGDVDDHTASPTTHCLDGEVSGEHYTAQVEVEGAKPVLW